MVHGDSPIQVDVKCQACPEFQKALAELRTDLDAFTPDKFLRAHGVRLQNGVKGARRAAARAGERLPIGATLTLESTQESYALEHTRRSERTLSPDSFDLLLQGLAWHNKAPTSENLSQARGFFKRALALDPRLVLGQPPPPCWDFATLVELAVLAEDEHGAMELAKALVVIREPWEPETTARNLQLVVRTPTRSSCFLLGIAADIGEGHMRGVGVDRASPEVRLAQRRENGAHAPRLGQIRIGGEIVLVSR